MKIVPSETRTRWWQRMMYVAILVRPARLFPGQIEPRNQPPDHASPPQGGRQEGRGERFDAPPEGRKPDRTACSPSFRATVEQNAHGPRPQASFVNSSYAFTKTDLTRLNIGAKDSAN